MSEWMDDLREKYFRGEKRGIEEFILFQLVTNPQGMDPNSLIPLLLLAGGGMRSDKFALVLALLASQQAQNQAQAGTTTTGVAPSTTNNLLPLLLLLMGDPLGYGEGRRRYHVEADDEDDEGEDAKAN